MRQQVLSAAEDIEDNTTTVEVIEDAEDNTTTAEVIEDIEGNTTMAEVTYEWVTTFKVVELPRHPHTHHQVTDRNNNFFRRARAAASLIALENNVSVAALGCILEEYEMELRIGLWGALLREETASEERNRGVSPN